MKFSDLSRGDRFFVDGFQYIKIDPLIEHDRVFGESEITAIRLDDGDAKAFYNYQEVKIDNDNQNN